MRLAGDVCHQFDRLNDSHSLTWFKGRPCVPYSCSYQSLEKLSLLSTASFGSPVSIVVALISLGMRYCLVVENNVCVGCKLLCRPTKAFINVSDINL